MIPKDLRRLSKLYIKVLSQYLPAPHAFSVKDDGIGIDPKYHDQ